jgi:hypothetical protein
MVKMVILGTYTCEIMYLLTIKMTSRTILHKTGTGELRTLGFLTCHLGPVHSQQTPFGAAKRVVDRGSLLSNLFPAMTGSLCSAKDY